MMSRIFSVFLIFLSACAMQEPIPCPECPVAKPCPTCPPPSAIVHDTVVRTDTVIKLAYLYQDTSGVSGIVKVFPLSGDNADNIQAAVSFCLSNACKVELAQGYYVISRPIMIVRINGLDYGQVSIDVSGPQEAKNAPDGRMAIIAPTFADQPALIVQRGKGVNISNIYFKGQYTLPNTLTPYSIQTMRRADWDDQKSDPYYAAAAIDPFSDPVYDGQKYSKLALYYLKGMSRAGSTGVNFTGCKITNFRVGILYEPAAQQNGDMCNVIDCSIEYCQTALAYCQDQTKGNHVQRLRSWGGVHTLIDCNYYGRGIGCMPFIDVVNTAGFIYQLFNCISGGRFTGSANNIYAESIFKIGVIGGNPVPTVSNMTVDLMDYGYAPDFIVQGNANLVGCQIRIYNGQTNKLNFSGFAGTFRDGAMEQPYASVIMNHGVGYQSPKFQNVFMMDQNWTWNPTISIPQYIGHLFITMNDNYTATLVAPGLNVGDYVTAGEEGIKYFDDGSQLPAGYNLPTVQIGRVKSMNGNIATLDQVSISVKPNVLYQMYKQ